MAKRIAKEANEYPPLEPLHVMVIGGINTGKSNFAATFPQPMAVLNFDKKFTAYDTMGGEIDQFEYPISPAGYVEILNDLAEIEKVVATSNGYKTVVVDSTTSLNLITMERALMLDPTRDESGGPVWNRHYEYVTNLTRGIYHRIMSLQCNIVIITHLDPIKNKDGLVIDYTVTMQGKLRQQIPSLFEEMYLSFTEKTSKGTKYKLRLTPAGLKPARSAFVGKLKGLPLEIENDFDSLKEEYEKRKNAFLASSGESKTNC